MLSDKDEPGLDLATEFILITLLKGYQLSRET